MTGATGSHEAWRPAVNADESPSCRSG